MPRLSSLDLDILSPAQKIVHDKIASGPRGSVRGPFAKLLVNPAIADSVQAMGAMLRFDGSLSDRQRELAILVTARYWTAQYEWYAHSKIAAEAGVADTIITAISQRRRPSFVNSEESVVYEFANELLEKREVGDEIYDGAVASLGEAGVVELIALIGYYGIISMTLNVAQVPLPDGEEAPLRP
jgi:4-carboxymuconolactone decarboxylase